MVFCVEMMMIGRLDCILWIEGIMLMLLLLGIIMLLMIRLLCFFLIYCRSWVSDFVV